MLSPKLRRIDWAVSETRPMLVYVLVRFFSESKTRLFTYVELSYRRFLELCVSCACVIIIIISAIDTVDKTQLWPPARAFQSSDSRASFTQVSLCINPCHVELPIRGYVPQKLSFKNVCSRKNADCSAVMGNSYDVSSWVNYKWSY